ncbi:tyrosine-type recombinase/integrase [Nocardia sp. CA-120079]|uniref:tyrosine-type recombinase/integrase n=1 Tax=Nocardia sp. CA-120079 TaxID=3239974 RepID=UPI003D986973
MTVLLAPQPVEDSADLVAGLWAAISPEFLAVIGWLPQRKVLEFPQDHPQLGFIVCPVVGCPQRAGGSQGICPTCWTRWKAVGRPPIEEFVLVERQKKRNRKTGCVVPGCERLRKTHGIQLCVSHDYQRQRIYRLPLDEFVRHPDVVGFPAFGPCKVPACTRNRDGRRHYCHAHAERWKEFQRTTGATADDEQRWRFTQSAIPLGGEVSLRGLPDRVVAELLFCLHYRTVVSGSKTDVTNFRPLGDYARANLVQSLEDISSEVFTKTRRHMHATFVTILRRYHTNPELERVKDEWDTRVFGHRGILRFDSISQPWLREAAKIWAYDELPRHRGGNAKGTCQTMITSMGLLSDSLRLQRPDHGNGPSALSRTDITAFLNRLAFLQAEGAISAARREYAVRHVRRVLERMRAIGLTRPGEPMHGLPEDFMLINGDTPDRAEDSNAGRDLPIEVMRFICTRLDSLEDTSYREIRVAVELIIDTGRRPDEICQLPLDCLERDGQGQPVLIYNNFKANRLGRRLPIQEVTAALIEHQQQRVREWFPNEPVAKLKLLPGPTRNPHGHKAITDGWVCARHREWVDSLPDIMVTTTEIIDGKKVTKMVPFDKSKIFPYVYRHTYAQRHADAGVGVEVLSRLMDHVHLSTTQGYYRVGEQRRREAVERVTTMQFDRHGNRVWREAKALLDSEHLRRAVGEVAVPYGACSEPSNVAAGGDDCPVRFRCVGCSHFSTDVSYLPDLEAYLADLLRSRERLRSAFAAADNWAKAEAMPSDEEISRIRRLISRVKADVDELSEEDRAQVEDAVSVVRRARTSIVGLGLPTIRQSLPAVRPNRSA